MTRCFAIATLATLAGAAAALFWAFVKVGGDFRVEYRSGPLPLPVVEPEFLPGELGW